MSHTNLTFPQFSSNPPEFLQIALQFGPFGWSGGPVAGKLYNAILGRTTHNHKYGLGDEKSGPAKQILHILGGIKLDSSEIQFSTVIL